MVPAETWLRPAPPADVQGELHALRAGLPGYDITVRAVAGKWRFDARRLHDGPGPYAVITTDPRELWRELAHREQK
jgi:hypothetical protein